MDNENTQQTPAAEQPQSAAQTPQAQQPISVTVNVQQQPQKKSTMQRIGQAVSTTIKVGKTLVLVGAVAVGGLVLRECKKIREDLSAFIAREDRREANLRPGETPKQHRERLMEEGQDATIRAAAEIVDTVDQKHLDQQPEETKEDQRKRFETEGNATVRTAAKTVDALESFFRGRSTPPQVTNQNTGVQPEQKQPDQKTPTSVRPPAQYE